MAIAATAPAPLSEYEVRYDPKKVLDHAEFRLLQEDAADLLDEKKNIACAYNEKHEVNMINKPVPRAGKGECVVHVKATGICG